jgi:hypothetical protein
MKSFFLLSFILLSSFSLSQPISVKATRQHWAGGVCCTTGSNYTVSIFGSLDSLNKSEIKYVMIDGNEFIVNQVPNKKNELRVFHFNFGISYDHRNEEIHLEKIKEVDHTKVKENYLVIIYNKQEMKIPITNIEELFYLAYP